MRASRPAVASAGMSWALVFNHAEHRLTNSTEPIYCANRDAGGAGKDVFNTAEPGRRVAVRSVRRAKGAGNSVYVHRFPAGVLAFGVGAPVASAKKHHAQPL